MPWLVRDKNKVYESDGKASSSTPNILFVHIPRCGGTALTKKNGVPSRAIETADNWLHRCGMRMFFYTYYLWERDNFPIWTKWNAFFAIFVLLNGYLRYYANIESVVDNEHLAEHIRGHALFNMVFGVLAIIGLSFIFVAPNFARVSWIRKAQMIMVEYFFLRSMDHKDCMTGMSMNGWLLHLTTHKMLNYGYLTPRDFHNCMSLAIVRNPYARMVSVYMYNRYGNESFQEFVKSWLATTLQNYSKSGVVEEWETPCHAIPQFEYTHYEGMQLVHAVLKQEEIKELESPLSKKSCAKNHSPDSPPLYDLPWAVKGAFAGLPRVNGRTTPKPWYDYYDQETLNMVYETYKLDFAIFGYLPTVAERPDLQPPPGDPIDLEEAGFELFSRNIRIGTNPTKRSLRMALLTKAASMPADKSSMGGFQTPISEIRVPEEPVLKSMNALERMFHEVTKKYN
eukprot:CAMPEP_0194212546 /NCGR_PEP_ID=MMETSP0156-20130528/12548_1 /TAXON_ID=33649 /ORGANISM="Thalassionema nitzschioides, Strain L26-B" /LENGTH=453 /DNA_ID=CAMNT_0038940401 /DNA_START=27 /DNA_END=1388 /DNA_ORIENTATION=-